MVCDTQTHTAYVALGSNLDTPEKHVCDAINDIGKYESILVVDVSPLYESEPMGTNDPQHKDQPVYINAVVKIETQLQPLVLLDTLQDIEQQHGRTRNGVRWGPRTLDLDILLYDELKLDEKRLTLPHYGMQQRNFVLYPLHDVAGSSLEIPSLGQLGKLLEICPNKGLKRLDKC